MQTLALTSLIALQLLFPPAKSKEPPPSPKPPETSAAVEPTPTPILQFNWPAGLDVRIDSERSREQQRGPGAKAPTSMKATYHMRVRRHDEGLMVRYEDFSLGQDFAKSLDAMGFQEFVGSLVPSTVVTRDGEFVRSEGTEYIQKILTEMLEPKSKDGDLPPAIQEMFQQMTSDEFLDSMAAGEWNGLIGNWHGFPLSDDVREETVEEPNVLVPDITIPMKVTMKMLEKGECPRGGERRACGLFEMRSEIDRAGVEPLLRRMLSDMKGMEEFKYEDFDILTVVQVRLEAATMLPHDFSASKTVSMRISGPGMSPLSIKQIEQRKSKFMY